MSTGSRSAHRHDSVVVTNYARSRETALNPQSHSRQSMTDQSMLCYNSFAGQGQLLWVCVCLRHLFGRRFSLVSMVSINFGILFCEVETGDTGESIEPEESPLRTRVSDKGKKTKWGRSSV